MTFMWTWVKKNPVAALTALYTILVGVDGVLAGAHLVSNPVLGYLAAGEAVLAVVLGVITHTKVTLVADPKAADGTPLVKSL